MPSYSQPPTGPRYGFQMYRPHYDPWQGVGTVFGYLIIAVIALGLWQRYSDGKPLFGSRKVRAYAMTPERFQTLREGTAAWTFTYLIPGEETLALHYGSSEPGRFAGATYDKFTDGRPAYTCEVGPRIREPLFRAIADSPSAFFTATEPDQLMRTYRNPGDWPYRPLFLFEAPGIGTGERYILAFGGVPGSGQLSLQAERVQAAVNDLKAFVVSHAKQPSNITNSTTLNRDSPRATAHGTPGVADSLSPSK